MADRVIAYVDGLNLYYGLLRGKRGRRWLDLSAVVAALVPGTEVDRVKYFTARVKDFDGTGAHQRQDVYLRALAAHGGVETHFGSFRVDKRRRKLVVPIGPSRYADVWSPEEKGSDVNLGSHLVLDGALGRYDLAVVVTNDSDLAEPIRLTVTELGKVVVLVHPSGAPAGRLVQAGPTQTMRLHVNTILKCQLPDPVNDPEGRKIRKPKDW